jgi:hypothetical protein
MEFNLPETVAKQLRPYDQTFKQIEREQRRAQADSNSNLVYMKRKTKLAFPCPEIFFDLDFKQIHEIYEDMCLRAAPFRYKILELPDGRLYFISWSKHTYEHKDPVEFWFCWKVIDKSCPLVLRQWINDTHDDDTYTEQRMDVTYSEAMRVIDNPFTPRYTKERWRYDALSNFISDAIILLNLPLYTYNNGQTKYNYTRYFDEKFFHERYYNGVSNQINPVLFLNQSDLENYTDTKVDIKIFSQIVNSKFFQSAVVRDAKNQLELLVQENKQPKIDSLIARLRFTYLFLWFYPEEYDRAVYLYQELEKTVVHRLSYCWEFSYIAKHPKRAELMDWIRSSITPQMFVHWILDQVELQQGRNPDDYRHDSTLPDTMAMMRRIFEYRTGGRLNKDNKIFEDPKRWRLEETHNHFSKLILLIDNKLTALPQDLIPQPRVFQTEKGMIRMFQPATNHEVIQWGKAVRNCVGSSGYDERVLKKQAFLVFAELDGKPWLTSLLTLNMGKIQVGQTVSLRNGLLAPEETALYYSCLGESLKQLESRVN